MIKFSFKVTGLIMVLVASAALVLLSCETDDPLPNSCRFPFDNQCDEPIEGGTGLCARFTDTSDCTKDNEESEGGEGEGEECTEERINECHNAWKGDSRDHGQFNCRAACLRSCQFGPDSEEVGITCEFVWITTSAPASSCPVCAMFR